MNILLNGVAQTLREGADVSELLEVAGLAGKRVAVEINLEVVPRSQYAARVLREGDRVEIVHAIGGG